MVNSIEDEKQVEYYVVDETACNCTCDKSAEERVISLLTDILDKLSILVKDSE